MRARHRAGRPDGVLNQTASLQGQAAAGENPLLVEAETADGHPVSMHVTLTGDIVRWHFRSRLLAVVHREVLASWLDNPVGPLLRGNLELSACPLRGYNYVIQVPEHLLLCRTLGGIRQALDDVSIPRPSA